MYQINIELFHMSNYVENVFAKMQEEFPASQAGSYTFIRKKKNNKKIK